MIQTTKKKDVQVVIIGQETKVIRSRTWNRLKFEVEYSLQKGTTANSYLIQADKTAVIDPPGESFTQNYLESLQIRLDWHRLDYVILGHFNTNRGATLKALLALAPSVTFVCSNPCVLNLKDYLKEEDLKIKVIKGEDTIDLGGGHQLQLITTPTPKWPDGLMTYDPKTQILFTDKFFGSHVCGDQVGDEGWSFYSEDRRFYYDCLHAAQAKQTLSTLEKISELTVKFYAPGHGPMVRYGMMELTNLYRKWSQEQSSRDLNVALLYASAYGNTATVAQAIARGLTKAGVAVESINCEVATSNEIREVVEKCDGFIIGSPTLGGHAPTQIQTALGIVLNTASKDKLAGVFGSFGWSGEAIDFLESKLKDTGYKFGFEPIRVKFKPDDVMIQTCKEAGIDFAQALIKSQQRRSPRASVRGSGSDRTAQAMGRVVGSLCVMSAKRGNVTSAMLASWVSQATFNPPGVTVAVAKDRALESLTHTGDKFVLNILAEEKKNLQRYFLKPFAPGEDRFTGVETKEANNGCPILTDALAYLECIVANRMECSDHWLVYAVVENGQLLNDGVTAVHFRKTGIHY
ncbi:MAG: diflavin flavoprotein [Trichodesmium sp. MAG_R02]|jgi:flavorubredoxin/flavin reductase (DIM6/NTAB) family NADH-FMN oxidoreductase RutF|nr:diflavin flavoprotein [Trichodesmium sp. MAG_R02]